MHRFSYSGTIKIYARTAAFIPDDSEQGPILLSFDEVKGYLHNHVKFDEGKVTVATLVDIILTDPAFYSYVLGVDMEAFCDGLNAPIEQIKTDDQDPVDVLKVSWCADSTKYAESSVMEMWAGLDGWGKSDIPYSLSTAPVADYISVPIVLEPQVKLEVSDVSKKDLLCSTDQILGDKTFTLLEVLHTIFFDLTFFGMPGSNAKKRFKDENEENTSVQEIDNDELNAFDPDEFDEDNGPEEDDDDI